MLVSVRLEISAQDRCTICAEMYHRHGNHFGHTRWWVTCVQWMLILAYLEIVLIYAKDRCMVCAECTTSMEIFPNTPNGTFG
jgi:hypothetical protein